MLKNQKHLFNLREGVHYLNCAYKAPLLNACEHAAIKALKRERNPVDLNPSDFFTEVREVRNLFGKMVNCSASEVAIIPSTSYGFSSVLNNISCKNGQHAITIYNEFPSDYFSIKRWCSANRAKLKVIKPGKGKKRLGKNWNQKILDSINKKTAVVILSSVHWMTGLKFDLEKIGLKCKAVGAVFIVDGTQSVGAMPMDVKKYNIDALVCASYKWMFGPYSLGLAYIGSRFNGGIPIEESWMNRVNAQNFSNLTDYSTEYWPDAGRYNVGQTSNFILIPMLHQALKQISAWTVPEIQLYCENLIDPLRNYLLNMDVRLEKDRYFSNHLFGLKLPTTIDTEQLKENLIKNNIFLSVRGNSLRVAVNVFNTSNDIEKLIEIIEKTRSKILT